MFFFSIKDQAYSNSCFLANASYPDITISDKHAKLCLGDILQGRTISVLAVFNYLKLFQFESLILYNMNHPDTQ